MKNILVPVDFSKPSENALKYAAFIAGKTKAELILFHSFYSPHATGHITTKAADSGKKIGRELAAQEMEEFFKEHVNIPGLMVQYKSSQKELRDELSQMVRDMKIDLIVMGTQGIGWLEGKLFGTNTAWVIENVNCPLIAIPGSEVTFQVKHITYATEYLASDIEHLKELESIAGLFDADITVMHVDLHESAANTKALNEFKDKINKELNSPTSVLYKSLKGNSVEGALEDYVDQHPMDLLVMSSQKRDAYDKLFGKSITKLMVQRLKGPILFFHHP